MKDNKKQERRKFIISIDRSRFPNVLCTFSFNLTYIIVLLSGLIISGCGSVLLLVIDDEILNKQFHSVNRSETYYIKDNGPVHSNMFIYNKFIIVCTFCNQISLWLSDAVDPLQSGLNEIVINFVLVAILKWSTRISAWCDMSCVILLIAF